MGGSGTVRDRGQLIMVGALALAIVLVGLALVLNSAIYAENFATRANQGEAGQITQLEQQAVQGAGGAMEHHHHDTSSHSTYDDLEDGFDTSIDEWGDMVVRDSARQGQYVDTNYTGTYTKGTRIAQDDGSTFEPQNTGVLNEVVNIGNVDQWIVTPGANRIRDFSMTVDHSELGDPLLEADAQAYLLSLELGADATVSEGAPYAVAYDENDDDDLDHSFAIYNSSVDSDDVNITYRNHDTDAIRTCTVEDPGSTFNLDVSNGQVEGGDGDCRDVFEFQSDMDPSQVIFIQGDQIAGDYEFIVDEEKSAFETDYNDLLSLLGLVYTFPDYYEDHDDGHGSSYSPTSPYAEPAMYSAEIRFRYQTDGTSYNGTRTVAPNEP